MKNNSLIFLLIFFSIDVFAENNNIHIGFFSSGKLDKWETKIFSGATDYKIVQLDDTLVLKAESHSGASGLFKEQKIDLRKTPYLNWRWRIENQLLNIDEQSKSGDDYSARVYVIVSGGWEFWKTKALNYVWASNAPKGKIWPNAFAGNSAIMIAIRSNTDEIQSWHQEKRNIMQDLKDQFGADIRHIDAVAIMTDTDNSKGDATAYYGDIYFSAQ